MIVVLLAFASLASVVWSQSPTPSPVACVNSKGEPTSFSIRATFFEDHSTGSWSLSLDASGSLRVRTGDGAQSLHVKETVVADIMNQVDEKDVWDWSATRGVPTHMWFSELAVCRAGRAKVVTSYGQTDGAQVANQDVEFVRIMVRLRGLFDSKRAEKLDKAEAYLNDLRAKARLK